jgi:hypothetical protein
MFIKVVHLEDSMGSSRTSPRCTVPCPDGWLTDSAICCLKSCWGSPVITIELAAILMMATAEG